MNRTHNDLPWCRYADDGLVHCRTEQDAQALLAELKARFAECGLEMHPTKSKIVYCKDGKRQGQYPNVTFDFLGYQFRPRMVVRASDKRLFLNFTPAVSPAALKSMRSKIRDLNIGGRTTLSLADIATIINPIVRGWIEYYGRYTRSALETICRHLNRILLIWAYVRFCERLGAKFPGPTRQSPSATHLVLPAIA
jgi:hypothetical protein